MAFDTAGNIILDAATELGLISFQAKPADAFASSDPNIGQLCQLLKSVGRNLVREHQWSNLQNIWIFSTAATAGGYAFPADYDRAIDQTLWNRTSGLPLGGAASPQVFESLSARMGVFNVLFRALGGKLQLYPDVAPGNYTIAYEYISRWWVVPAATQLPTAGPWVPSVTYSASAPDYVVSGGNVYRCVTGGKSGTAASPSGTGAGIADGTAVWAYASVAGQDAPTAHLDMVQFDPQLARAALKLAWRAEKGLEATAAFADYQSSLEKAKGADIQAPSLNFYKPSGDDLIGWANVPGMGG